MIILASNSKTRAKLLRNAGVEFENVPPGIDEESIKVAMQMEGAKPRDISAELGATKARKISQKYPGNLVLGSDQILSLDGEIFSKAESKQSMILQLKKLRGKKHDLYSSAVIALDGQPIWRHIGEANIEIRDCTDSFLENYVYQNYETLRHNVGGYQIESIGVQLIENYSGDYFSILGLPIIPLLAYLRERGELRP